MKKALLVLLLLTVIFAIVVGTRFARFTSRQVDAPTAAPIAVDIRPALQRLGRAITYRTVSSTEQDGGPADFRAFRDYLSDAFPKTHGRLTREVVNGSSLLYTWKGADEKLKPILLAAHMDVVPVNPADEARWQYGPFSGAVAEGHVWGRGTMDDKGSLLAMLEAVEYLSAQGFQPRRTIYLAFGHDEEIGGQNGAAKIAGLLAVRRTELQWVLDEGANVLDGIIPGIAAPTALIGIAEKGYLSLELTVETPGGHTSIPPTKTAIGVLSRAIATLDRSPFPSRLSEPTKQMLVFLGPHMPWIARLLLANLWLSDPLVRYQMARIPVTNAAIRTTVVPTMMEAGIKENVLAPRARAVVNLRLLPGDTIDGAIERVRKIIADPAVRIAPFPDRVEPSPVSSPQSAEFKLLEQTIRETIPGSVVAPALLVAGTDARHYGGLSKQIFRFFPITLRPADLERYHGINERIAAQDYARAIRFYVQLIKNSQTPGD